MDYKKQIGLVIKIYRKRAGFSQETLGFEIGISQQQINAYETGVSSISVDKLMTIANVLKIPLNEIFKDDKTRNLIVEFKDAFQHYEEIIKVIKENPKLADAVKFYGKNIKKLKDLDLLKLLNKISQIPESEKATTLKRINKMLA